MGHHNDYNLVVWSKNHSCFLYTASYGTLFELLALDVSDVV